MVDKETIVISLGGSLIAPDKPDSEFLSKFKQFVETNLNHNKKFILICGGGKTCRYYQEAAQKVSNINHDNLDWIGIYATKINAILVKSIFSDVAHENIIDNPTKEITFDEQILVASGWKPGFSSDFDAVLLAEKFNAKKIINLSNIDYAYDKDPRKFEDAKPIHEISWQDFLKLIPSEWKPGLNSPFDPVASRKAQELNIEVAILNGKNIENLQNYIENKEFVGTKIN